MVIKEGRHRKKGILSILAHYKLVCAPWGRHRKKEILTILFLLVVVGVVDSQTDFVQSRFSGVPILDIGARCVHCMPHKDGVLEYRIANNRVVASTATFSIQLRIIGGDQTVTTNTRLAFASVRLTYNPLAFGDNVVSGRRCIYEEVGVFKEKNYRSSFNDTTADTMTFTMARLGMQRASELVRLDDQFRDFVVIECRFEDESKEADIAISGTDILSNMIYIYTDASEADAVFVKRNIFPLAHNSLRSLRLDGKSYAADYARYSDGKGVYVEFSKNIETELTTDYFFIDKKDETVGITEVLPVSDGVVRVEFSRAVSGGVLRSSLSEQQQITDEEGNRLAFGGFIAALEYDEHAPRVTAIRMDSQTDQESSWLVDFSRALDSNTIKLGNLCLSNKDSITCRGTFQHTVSIKSVTPVPVDAASTTRVAVVISKDERTDGPIFIALKRNRVRGEEQRIAEEYQVALEEGIILKENHAPQIVELSTNSIALLDEGPISQKEVMVAVLDENFNDDVTISAIDKTGNAVVINPTSQTVISGGVRQNLSFMLQALNVTEGVDTQVEFTASDNDMGKATTEIQVIVENNVAPTISGLASLLFMKIGTTETLSFTVLDENTDIGDTVNVSVNHPKDSISSDLSKTSDDTYSLTVGNAPLGVTTLTVSASDSASRSVFQNIRLVVADTDTDNSLPKIIEPTSGTVIELRTVNGEGTSQVVVITILDEDIGDKLAIQVGAQPDGIVSLFLDETMLISNGQLLQTTLSIAALRQGVTRVTIKATDDRGGSDSTTIDVQAIRPNVRIRIRIFLEAPLP